VFYEVFVRSFEDSDGDGVGDLQGLTSKLDYLKGLGVDALWLMPVFESPSPDPPRAGTLSFWRRPASRRPVNKEMNV
jgi:glycosidase